MDTSPSSCPPVSIVIVNWNGWRDTLTCLADLRELEYPDFRLTVIDNGSTDASELRIRQAHPDVALIQSGANLGFAAAHNIGIQLALSADSRYIWLLNNDTRIPPDCLDAMVSAMEGFPSLGILGPTVQNQTTGRPEPLNRFPPGIVRPGTVDDRVESALRAGGVELLDAAPGAGMLVRREVLEELGGLDERYFHYFEDTDLCWRAWRAGWLVGRTGACTILHQYGASTSASRPRALYYMLRNILLFASQASNVPVRTLMISRPVLWAWALGPLFGIRSFKHPATKAAVLRALRDAMRGKDGRCPTYSPP